jgi:hypothetical protein
MIFSTRHCIYVYIHTLREEEEEDKEAPAAAVLRSLDASVVLEGFLCLWVCVAVAIICLPVSLILYSRWQGGATPGNNVSDRDGGLNNTPPPVSNGGKGLPS